MAMRGAPSSTLWRPAALGVLALALVVAGCSSSGGDGSTDETPAFVGPVVAPDLSAPLGDPTSSADLGDDGVQGALASACEGGRFRACDDLYQRGDPTSTYATYAFSCGGRLNPPPAAGEAPNCRLRSVGHVPVIAPASPVEDSPTLDALAESCSADGGLESCDQLFRTSEAHTVYESYGITCGGRTLDTRPNACVGLDGIPRGKGPGDLGEDVDLNGLADECFNARISSCDELYSSADRGSSYEAYAQSCGGRLADPVERVQPSCDLRFNDPVRTTSVAPPAQPLGDAPELDLLVAGCADGEYLAACDQLFMRSPLGSDYENFGATCGGRFAAQRRNLEFSAAGECDARAYVESDTASG